MNQVSPEKLLQIIGELYVKDRITADQFKTLTDKNQNLQQENEKLLSQIEGYEKDITPNYPD